MIITEYIVGRAYFARVLEPKDVISFSMMFSMKLSIGLRGPSSLVISFRLFMSDLSIVFVNSILMKKVNRKIVPPMISFIQLLKLSCERIT